MIEIIREENIQVMISATDWQDAIRRSACPLIESGAIEQSYVDAMIDSAVRNGPYFVITKGIALAHARPECGVNRLEIGITTLKSAVLFHAGENDPVWMIIVLAAVDSDSHIDLLGEFADKLMDRELMDSLRGCRTSREFRQVLLGVK